MFTLPDNANAAPTCPPLSPPGPQPNGFFQDCGTGGAGGTIPTAEDFNELILNLRALLAHAGVPGVKADPTMLWRCIVALIRAYTIDSVVTIHVAPGGSAAPANPFAGDPFDTLASAWAWLGYYSITARGYVTIQLATAFYYHSAPLVLDHANGDRISVVGGDLYTTLLYFNADTSGVAVTGDLAVISNLTIYGTKVGGTIGLTVDGTCGVFAAVVQGFDTAILVRDNGFLGAFSLWVNDCLGGGLSCINGGAAEVTTLNCLEIGFGIGAAYFVAGVNCTAGGVLVADSINCNRVHKGVDISGAGSELRVRLLHVHDREADGVAVEANDGGVIIAAGGVPGDWTADPPGYFWAAMFGFIRADESFNTWSFVSASPAPQVLGNVNAMVWTSSAVPPVA